MHKRGYLFITIDYVVWYPNLHYVSSFFAPLLLITYATSHLLPDIGPLPLHRANPLLFLRAVVNKEGGGGGFMRQSQLVVTSPTRWRRSLSIRPCTVSNARLTILLPFLPCLRDLCASSRPLPSPSVRSSHPPARAHIAPPPTNLPPCRIPATKQGSAPRKMASCPW